MDFFYEPAKGLVKSPQAFGKGLAKGSISLLKHTFTGVFGAASKITGSVGKGVAILTMDDEFIARNSGRNQKQPKHAMAGVATGVQSLGSGLLKGVAGVVLDPMKGAQKDGVGGFFKGIGKGLVGVVAKPTAGLVDMASQTLKGVGNTADFLLDSRKANEPVRPQRWIDPQNPRLKPYDLGLAKKAAAQKSKQR
jgi:hypothetical protein